MSLLLTQRPRAAAARREIPPATQGVNEHAADRARPTRAGASWIRPEPRPSVLRAAPRRSAGGYSRSSRPTSPTTHSSQRYPYLAAVGDVARHDHPELDVEHDEEEQAPVPWHALFSSRRGQLGADGRRPQVDPQALDETPTDALAELRGVLLREHESGGCAEGPRVASASSRRAGRTSQGTIR